MSYGSLKAMKVFKPKGESAVLTLLLCASIAGSGLCDEIVFPSDMNVSEFDTAFFPCEVPDRGAPVWVINSIQYYSNELPPDHRTNISGLLVFARLNYNQSIYQCRFLNISVTDFGFIDREILTSPAAVLIVTKADGFEDPHDCLCMRNSATEATYNYTTQVLNLAVKETLSENYPVSISYCNNGRDDLYLNQTCSAIDVNLSPETFSGVIAIAIPPVCNTCYPDYVTYMAIQFSNNATVPSSMQQIQFSGNCLEPILKRSFSDLCSDTSVIFSANGSSVQISLANETTNFFEVTPLEHNVIVCFKNTDPFFQEFGDVEEVLVQEYCTVFYFELCTNLSVIGMNHELGLFGSRGILTLDLNGIAPQPDTVCSLKNNTTPSPASSSTASPSTQITSSSQHFPTPHLSSSSTHSTGLVPSFNSIPSPTPSQTLSPTNGPSHTWRELIVVLVVVGICLFLIILMIIGIIIWFRKRICRSVSSCLGRSGETEVQQTTFKAYYFKPHQVKLEKVEPKKEDTVSVQKPNSEARENSSE